MKTSHIILSALILSAATGCHHKDLLFPEDSRVSVNVVFDWVNAPDANPESMALMMYDTDGSHPLRYIFNNHTGGPVDIPLSSYTGLCINGDINDWAQLRNTDNVETFELFTSDAEVLESYGLSTLTLPRARDNDNERIAKTPHLVWSDRQGNIDLTNLHSDKTITFYPEEDVCHYTVDIYDVDNISSIRGTSLDATISGMAEGYLHGKRIATTNHVTMPFVLSSDPDAGQLHGEFLTFGECPGMNIDHIMSVYVFLTDGTRVYYNFDVTRQVADAPDPHHVHIIIHGLPLPNPFTGDSGLHPEVNEWEAVYVGLKM